MPGGKKRTIPKMIKAYILEQKGESYVAIGEKLGCSDRTVKSWANEIRNNPHLRHRAEGKMQKSDKETTMKLTAPSSEKELLHEVSSMQERIAYLEWRLLGERRGFVDRLLEDIGKE